jgi:hypothetical protein
MPRAKKSGVKREKDKVSSSSSRGRPFHSYCWLVNLASTKGAREGYFGFPVKFNHGGKEEEKREEAYCMYNSYIVQCSGVGGGSQGN